MKKTSRRKQNLIVVRRWHREDKTDTFSLHENSKLLHAQTLKKKQQPTKTTILGKAKDHFLGSARNYKSLRKINNLIEIWAKNTK